MMMKMYINFCSLKVVVVLVITKKHSRLQHRRHWKVEVGPVSRDRRHCPGVLYWLVVLLWRANAMCHGTE